MKINPRSDEEYYEEDYDEEEYEDYDEEEHEDYAPQSFGDFVKDNKLLFGGVGLAAVALLIGLPMLLSSSPKEKFMKNAETYYTAEELTQTFNASVTSDNMFVNGLKISGKSSKDAKNNANISLKLKGSVTELVGDIPTINAVTYGKKSYVEMNLVDTYMGTMYGVSGAKSYKNKYIDIDTLMSTLLNESDYKKYSKDLKKTSSNKALKKMQASLAKNLEKVDEKHFTELPDDKGIQLKLNKTETKKLVNGLIKDMKTTSYYKEYKDFFNGLKKSDTTLTVIMGDEVGDTSWTIRAMDSTVKVTTKAQEYKAPKKPSKTVSKKQLKKLMKEYEEKAFEDMGVYDDIIVDESIDSSSNQN